MEGKRKKAIKQLVQFISSRCDAENIYEKAMDQLSAVNIPEISLM